MQSDRKGPDGTAWDLESDDPLEGSDYVEPGTSTNVSNGASPRYFGLSPTGPLDVREAAGLPSAVNAPFQELPTGYHVQDGQEVFGDLVTEERKAHVMSDHGRPGQRRAKRAAT